MAIILEDKGNILLEFERFIDENNVDYIYNEEDGLVNKLIIIKDELEKKNMWYIGEFVKRGFFHKLISCGYYDDYAMLGQIDFKSKKVIINAPAKYLEIIKNMIETINPIQDFQIQHSTVYKKRLPYGLYEQYNGLSKQNGYYLHKTSFGGGYP